MNSPIGVLALARKTDSRHGWKKLLALLVGLAAVMVASTGLAEGSRTLYPVTYPAGGSRADLDLTGAANLYAGVAARRQFLYVYANAGEYIELGSSNRANGGDIFVYNPQSFGTKGNETIPGAADFTCSAAPPAGSFGGGTTGQIVARINELAGPNSANNVTTVANGYAPCAYLAPSTGVYGVLFSVATAGGGGPTGSVGTLHIGNATVAAWEVAVRAGVASTADINARVFTYGFIAFTGGNGRPVDHTLYYATLDGLRYQQTMQGLDPNGYALWGNTSGFFDNGQPLYKDLRGNGALVNAGYPAELTAQIPQAPVFVNSIDPAGANAAEVATVLTALGIPLSPPPPQINSPAFVGLQSGNQTYVGGGGTFTFTATNDTSYQIVVSAGVDFDPANPANATLTGLAPNGPNSVIWNGLANNATAFSPGTFTFQIIGRNGEIHFPIIDSEGNKFGGPTLTKLNGASVGDHTVYYDDRGYVTKGNVTIGTLNGLLCPANPPVPPTPDHSLAGVDSSLQNLSGANCNGNVGTCFYRYWPGNGNSNTDCAAAAGFGDAKGLDLWTFQQTPAQSSTLVINPADITLAKAGPATVQANGSLVYTISLGNSGSLVSGTTLTVADVLPAGVTFVSAAAGTNVTSVTCTGTTTLSCTVNLTAGLAGGAANGAAAFTITTTAPSAPGNITNFASVDPTGGATPPTPGAGCAPAASCGNATTLVVAPPTISKSFGAASIALNGSTSLSFTISNPNAATTLTGVGVTDNLPAGLVVATPNGLAGACGGGAITAVAGSNSVSLLGATLAASASCTFSVNVTGTTAGVKNNTTGSVTSNEGGQGGTASATLTVVAPPTIAKVFGAATIALNGSTSLSFTVGNPNASTPLTGVGVTDTLPAGLVIATPNGLAGACGGGTITATAGSNVVSLAAASLAAGASCTFSVNVTGTTVGVKNNTTGNVTSNEGGPGGTASASLTVIAPPTIAKVFGAATIALNGSTSLSFTIGNPNASTILTGVGVTDALPAGLVISTPNGLAGACGGGAITAAAGSNSVSLLGATLAAGGSCTFSANVTGTTAGIQNNTTGNVTSANGGNGGTASASLTVVAPPTIAKVFGAASIALNGSTALTFTIGNPNASTMLTGVGVTDTLPAGLVIATPNGLVGSCGGGAITATAGSNVVSLSAASLAANASCTFSVNVTGTTVGVKVNTTGNVTSTNGGTGNTATANLTVTPPVNITLAKTGPATVQTNGALVYTLSLGNSGGTASGTTLTVADVLPPGVTYVSTAPGTNVTTVTCLGATTLSCTVNLTAALAAGAANGAATFAITTTAPNAAGSITNYASVDPTGGTTPPAPGAACTPATSCGSATTTVKLPVNITLAKAGPATVQTNGTLIYAISLGNSGGTASGTTLTVADVLPPGVTYVSAAPGTNVTTVACLGATTLSCTVNLTAALAAGAANGAATFTITTTAPSAGGSITNFASVDPSGGTNPPTPGAGCAPATSCGSATTTVNLPVNITLAKAGPATVQANGALIYTISLGNSGGTASGTTLTVADVLPPGVTYVSTAPGTNVTTVACLGASTLSCTVNLTAALAAGAANGAATFTITATAPSTGGSITNFASVDPSGGTSPPTPGLICLPATSCGSATTTVNLPVNITLTKAGPATVQVNASLIYTISLGNSGGTASGTTLTVADVLPLGVTYQSTAAGTNVSAVTCTGATTLSCTVNLTAALAAGAANGAATFTIATTAPSTAGSITNFASVDPSGGTNPPTPGAGCTPAASCGSATTTVNTPVNITLTKTGPATVQANGTLIYTISLGNSGQTASGTTLTVADVLPAGVTYQNVTAGTNVTSVTCTGTSTLSCTINLTAALAAGAANGAATFTITTTAPGTGGSLTNFASVDPSGGTKPPTPGAGCAPATSCGSATTTVNTPRLQIVKTGPATATAGGNIVYTIAVTNIGAGTATNAILSDPAPSGLTYVSAGAPCASGFPCNLGTLTAGQSVTVPSVTFAIASNVTGTIVNVASVSSDQTTQTSSSASAVIQGGVGSPVAPTPIDARWMLLAMMALLAGMGAWWMRARS